MADEPRVEPVQGSPSQDAALHLRVHPSVVFKLGQDLITDDVQALVELVKNAYDADSPTASIKIDTQTWCDPNTGQPVPPPALPQPPHTHAEDDRDGSRARPRTTSAAVRGVLTITDRGDGMTRADIERGWLTVSSSSKRVMKEQGHKTAKKRTPLGDKGLGRLGAQRLGEFLELHTVPRNEDVAYSITIPWGAFDEAATLDEVELQLHVEDRNNRRSGSELRVLGLRSPDRWQATQLRNLQRELSTMISPFGGTRGFSVTLSVDGTAVDLRVLPQAIRSTAELTYRLAYDGGILTIDGALAASYVRPDKGAELPAYRELVERDNGASFLAWLLTTRGKKAGGIGLSEGDDKFFARVHQTFALSDLDGVHLADGHIADPGPFAGEVDQVPLGRDTDTPSVFGSLTEYRDYVRDINGVKVYRDGFGIRVDQDWLGLGKRWTSGTSFYNLRPDNVIGFIDLTAERNSALLETTNREGFQDTAAHRNFLLLLDQWRKFTEIAQGFLRRGWLDYRAENLAADAHVEPVVTPSALIERVTRQQASATASVGRATELSGQLAEVRRAARDIHQDALEPTSLPLTGVGPSSAVRAALARIDSAVDRADKLLEDLQTLASNAEQQKQYLALLAHQINILEAQLSDAWEAVALGLTAEALSHEVHNVADRLRGRSTQITRYLDDSSQADPRIRSYVEHVRSSATALNRQLAHLNPALRYMRERRERIVMSEALTEFASYFADRWQQRGLSIEVDVVGDFTVVMNRGKLSQVFDNLLLNSEYWMRRPQSQEGTVINQAVLQIRSPSVTVTDTGPGVDPAVEELLFEPFVTMKGQGKGRGLGLFVVRQLLITEGAQIELDPERNSHDRRYKFRLTFVAEPPAAQPTTAVSADDLTTVPAEPS